MEIRRKLLASTMAAILGLGILAGGVSVADDRNRQEPTAGEMFADAVVVRPVTLIASGVGLVAWVATLPFSLPSGSAADAGQAWVLDPLRYTFVRPLGEMSADR